MPLASKLAVATAGLLTEGDYVSLSSGMLAVGGLLADRAAGARHHLHPRAVRVIRWLQSGVDATAWHTLAHSQGLSDRQFTEIVGFLYDIGGIHIRRSFGGSLRMVMFRLAQLTRGVPPEWVPRRWPATIRGVCKAVTRLCVPLVLLVSFINLLIYVVSFASRPAAQCSVVFVVVFWASTTLHELAHAAFIARSGRAAMVMQRGLRIGILHQPFERSFDEVRSALAGPFVGSVVAFGLCSLAYVATGKREILVLEAGLVGLQLLSLLPVYGDGKILWKAVFR